MNHILGDKLHSLLKVGIALSAEKNLGTLLDLIVEQAIDLLNADAATLFLVENTQQEKKLIFKYVKNASQSVSFKEFSIPMDEKSLAGYVAVHRSILNIPDVYSIEPNQPYTFNREYDEKTGYRSTSLLCAPLMDHRNELIGVIQVWNKKKSDNTLTIFTDLDQDILLSLASQAAIAIENAKLYEEIQNLFKGFIQASVKAIESRDPTTSGHSERVAKLSLALCQEVSRIQVGPYKQVYFSNEHLKQIEYASLLHDFGKIGVREAVLVKSQKLFPFEKDLFLERIELLLQQEENRFLKQKIELIQRNADQKALDALDETFSRTKQHILNLRTIVLQANEPQILPTEVSTQLDQIRAHHVVHTCAETTQHPLLPTHALEALKTPKGSLSQAERLEIEAHVSHTYAFLKQIPWTQDLAAVPEIAYGHHEKLDGTGYPLKIKGDTLRLEARIMGVVDIFDALVAHDRPYKKALPLDKALSILRMEADQKKLDTDLVELFIQTKPYKALFPCL